MLKNGEPPIWTSHHGWLGHLLLWLSIDLCTVAVATRAKDHLFAGGVGGVK